MLCLLYENLNRYSFVSKTYQFQNIQRMILQDVRYKNGDSCEDHVGNYRLSSLTTAKSAELMREERWNADFLVINFKNI